MSTQVLPRIFYRGKAKARKTLLVFLSLIVVSSTVLTVSGRLDFQTLLGPHVARSEWAFTMTGVRQLNALGLTGKGVTVCLVDSGLDTLHPDFSHLQVAAWRDFVNLRPQPYDDNGHGTAMAGLIAADGAIHGAAPQVQLIVAKVINSAGNGSPKSVADAINFCINPKGNGGAGADIISLSLGSESGIFFDVTVYNAVISATSQGVFVVAAAGNDGLFDDGDVSTPAQPRFAIAVGAVDFQGVKAPFSSIGALFNRTDPNLKPELVAPGVRLISTFRGAHYITITGTSPAAALTAGILALLLQAKPGLKPGGSSTNILTMKIALASGAKKAPPGQTLPHDPWYGYGIVYGPGTLSRL